MGKGARMKLNYNITKSNIKDYYNLKIKINELNALNQFDIGETTLLCISKDRCEYELNAYIELGYTLESDVETELKKLGWL